MLKKLEQNMELEQKRCEKNYYFACGGTGGHIYPALIVAEKLKQICPDANIHFFCSEKSLDKDILSKTQFSFSALPAKSFSRNPGKLIRFCQSFLKSAKLVHKQLSHENSIVIGTGGFVTGPVCWAAYRLKIPVVLINMDMVAGRANKIVSRWAKKIFVQFEKTIEDFRKYCPNVCCAGAILNSDFDDVRSSDIIEKLSLNKDKKIIALFGGSTGAVRVNEAFCYNLKNMARFNDAWQIVHITGKKNVETVQACYENVQMEHRVIGYCDEMASLLNAADLVVGRSGASSVAEYIASKVPVICMPYPHHKDMQQYLNASILIEAGCGIIVDDVPNLTDRGQWLWEELEPLLADDEKRWQMEKAYEKVTQKNGTIEIAAQLKNMVG